MRKELTLGILAHVDAGKTTLAEGILLETGCIRQAGRVDHQNTYLDHFALERKRGITIFSKQAILDLGDVRVTLLDTPGHADFSAEMERCLSILDYGILVISGADGVQSHTAVLWKLLEEYQIPVFLFINKMDQAGSNRGAILGEIRRFLDEGCLDFGAAVDSEEMQENLSMTEEGLLEQYLAGERIREDQIAGLIKERKVFPCYFGSALKGEGLADFLGGLQTYMRAPVYGEEFGGRVFKISRDANGNRLTHVKITGGRLPVKTVVDLPDGNSEKVDQIRLYSGSRFETVTEAEAGSLVALLGLETSRAGMGLGKEKEGKQPLLEPVLNYRIHFPEGTDIHKMAANLRELEEEDPCLRIRWDVGIGELQIQVMGEIQLEIIKELLLDRFAVEADFGQGNVLYKETITGLVEGVGHFEPLRHYAEVHLLMEPLPRGAGIVAESSLTNDQLDSNWQRLVLSHVLEGEHMGVLTGSPITDVKFILAGGRAHLKHTEGGDFRQASYRAIRQGLMEAESILLEPWYRFRLELPQESLGRAMADIQRMGGSFNPPDQVGDFAMLEGKAPVVEMQQYHQEVQAFSHGRGKLLLTPAGYDLCHNQAEVVKAFAYDAQADIENTPDSVFCSHGAGYRVPWYEVKDHMHLPSALKKEEGRKVKETFSPKISEYEKREITRQELEEIFERTYGPPKRRPYPMKNPEEVEFASRDISLVSKPYKGKKKAEEEYLLVDGYNIIFAWEELAALAEKNIDSARDRLADILCNYQGYKKCTLILVFDAYKLKEHGEEVSHYHNIHIVYTKEAETADQYIEKTVHKLGKHHQVTVATSDGLEQIIIQGEGGLLLSAREFKEEIDYIEKEIQGRIQEKRMEGKSYLFDQADAGLAAELEKIRLGKEEK